MRRFATKILFVASAGGAATLTAPASGAPGEPNNAAQSTGLTEIVVTAQRHTENLQEVPIAVTALTPDELQSKGATTSEDLTAVVPGVVFNPGGGGGQITIRGIGGTNSGVDAGNAVYIDGVYQFSPFSNVFDFNAIERVEVLKGPQGTLFGRNSIGGLVNVITRDPTQRAAAEVTLGYANYDTPSGSMYFNTPLTDTLAMNLAAFGREQNEGWGENLLTGEDVHQGYARGARTKVKWQAPGGATDFTLVASYNENQPVSAEAGHLGPGTFSVGGFPSVGIYDSLADAPQTMRSRQYTLSGTLHHDVGFARVTSITAYDSVRSLYLTDADQSPLPLLQAELAGRFLTFSQELHLQSQENAPVQWIVGGLYLNNRTPVFTHFQGLIDLGPAGSNLTRTTSYATFGQAIIPITNGTRVTAGLRYTHDELELHSHGARVDETKANKVTWRLALDHQFSDAVMGYVSYARGFKSGLFNATNPDAGAASPETLDAYELGVKTELFDHRMRVNAALFHSLFKEVQVQLFDPLGYISNAGNARVTGLDLEVLAEPIAGLTLTASASLLDPKFTTSPAGFNCFVAQPAETNGGIVGSACELDGRYLPFAPKTTISAGVQYKIVSSVGDFVSSLVDTHNSGYYSEPSNFKPAYVPSFDRLNASVTWTSPSNRLNASIWGKNLLDEHTTGGGGVSPPFGAIIYPMAPRTYGITVGAKF